MEERRRSHRRELTSKLVVKKIGTETTEEENVEIEIVDVSKTGIGFICNKALAIGEVYEAYLRIWTQEVLHAFVEIVRIEKKDDSFGYGGIFIGMPAMDASRIEVYDTVESMTEEES